MKEYITFRKADQQNPKTEVWKVVSEGEAFDLATIKWYGPWRKYCLFPDGDVIFDAKCLTRITTFINELMGRRDESRKKKKTKG